MLTIRGRNPFLFGYFLSCEVLDWDKKILSISPKLCYSYQDPQNMLGCWIKGEGVRRTYSQFLGVDGICRSHSPTGAPCVRIGQGRARDKSWDYLCREGLCPAGGSLLLQRSIVTPPPLLSGTVVLCSFWRGGTIKMRMKGCPFSSRKPPSRAHPQLLGNVTSFSTEVESRRCLDF